VLGRATGNTDTQDSPRPGPRGSHHLPPYSILCSSRQRWHPNGHFSRDSRVGVPKLSRVGVPRLWTPISPNYRVRSQRGLKQSCSPRRELANAVLHSQIGCREGIDSRLLVVESQIASFTPGPSFAHNLRFRCRNEQCEPILDIYVSRAFQRYQERNNPLRFDPSARTLKFRESTGSPPGLPLPKWELPWECGCSLPHTPSPFLRLPGVCDDSRASSWPASFQCLCLCSRASFLLIPGLLATPCLGREPKARVATVRLYMKDCVDGW
jgi:hypothetical protein